VHTRDAFERALELPTWPASSLHIAAWHGDLELVRSLVRGSADLTARAEDSDATPLDWAVGASRSEWGSLHTTTLSDLSRYTL
jgi:ankyrin repeat protein